MLAEHVSERLALVLADRQPRRAQVEDQRTGLAPTVPHPPAPAPSSAAEDAPGPGPLSVEEPDLLGGLPPVRRFNRRHLSVLCGLVVIGLLLAGWSLLRARPVAIASPGAVVVGATTPAPRGSASTTPSATRASIVVHVLGAVRHPGLVTLPEPARVQDAIDAAGGLKSGADPGEINLAQALSDGQQVVIGKKSDRPSEVRDGGSGGTGGGGSGGGGGGASAVLDLNRATSAQLEALPGVGPVTAGKILAWRQEHGRFTRVEELQEVDGIGPKSYAQLAPHLRV